MLNSTSVFLNLIGESSEGWFLFCKRTIISISRVTAYSRHLVVHVLTINILMLNVIADLVKCLAKCSVRRELVFFLFEGFQLSTEAVLFFVFFSFL